MTDKIKSVQSRPKVRFSQSAESQNSVNDARTFAKPKIRSIIDLKPNSIRIIKPANDKINNNSDSAETGPKRLASNIPNNLLCPTKSSSKSAPCLTEITFTPENVPLRAKTIVKTKETQKSVATKLSVKKVTPLSKSVIVAGSCGSLPSDVEQSQQICKVENRAPRAESPTTRDDKENIGQLPESIGYVSAIEYEKTKSKSAAVCRKDATPVLSGTKVAAVTQKATKTGPNTVHKCIKDVGLMPCAKARSKAASMKKTMVRDISAGRSNVYMGPGVFRQTSQQLEAQPTKPKVLSSRSAVPSGERLLRPEYNSIVGTMKKLQDLREEKVKKDLEHLPAAYRGLVNGKVSSALDFGANEAIYRDLVDLTIDEKQLPTRLTRSKDPEPRQRDLVPKLSDFFVPTNDEEYRKAVFPRPPSPCVLDSSNPYKISDRIFMWKESLDHDS